jgi:hypothetical protein
MMALIENTQSYTLTREVLSQRITSSFFTSDRAGTSK